MPKTPLRIGDAVCFSDKQGILEGHILERRDGDRFAKVIDAEERVWKLPQARLVATRRARRRILITPYDDARAPFRVGDSVVFERDGEPQPGEIVKLNPKRALVLHDGHVWRVPYTLMRKPGDTAPAAVSGRLRTVANMARRLMDEHHLKDWTLAFVESYTRAGDCLYRDRLIRISRRHALEHADDRIRDTVLHEIAHAIAGPEAGHGPLWKAVARRIGATPETAAYETDLR